MSDSAAAASNNAMPKGSKAELILCVLLLVSLLGLGKFWNAQVLLKQALDCIENIAPWGPVVFVVLYVLATVLFLPGSILTLGAGLVFGVAKGSILVSISATLGATAAFFVGRYLARGWVSKQIEANATFNAIDEAVAAEGWKIVGLTRLSPAFPFNLLNYAFGATRVTPRVPGTVMCVYIGSLAGDLATVGAGQHVRTASEWTLSTVGLLATIGVTVSVTRLARAALKKRIPV